MPFILLWLSFATAALASSGPLYFVLFLLMIAGILFASASLSIAEHRRNRLQAMAAAMVSGYAAAGIGAVSWMAGRFDTKRKWSAATVSQEPPAIPASVRIGKRIFDLAGAMVLLTVLAIVFIPVAIAIRLEGRGPIFYRQLRVGQMLPDRTMLFELIKFRTMRTDAERHGAAWATKGDSRITRVGNFLRKSRLDELPQAINILRGEMSLIGPRPERPVFFSKLENSIPLYIERTYGILPGITGLAQVNQGYDETIEDVREKVGWDHAYALHLDSVWNWLKADIPIALATVGVMAGRKGQ